jgi:hypothetical protein
MRIQGDTKMAQDCCWWRCVCFTTVCIGVVGGGILVLEGFTVKAGGDEQNGFLLVIAGCLIASLSLGCILFIACLLQGFLAREEDDCAVPLVETS